MLFDPFSTTPGWIGTHLHGVCLGCLRAPWTNWTNASDSQSLKQHVMIPKESQVGLKYVALTVALFFRSYVSESPGIHRK